MDRTGRIFPFRILAEFSVGSGIRRIEAVAGKAAVDYLSTAYETLERTSASLKGTPADIEMRLGRLQTQTEDTKVRLNAVTSVLARTEGPLPAGEQMVFEHIPAPAFNSVFDTTFVVHRLADHWDDDFLLKRVNILKVLSFSVDHSAIPFRVINAFSSFSCTASESLSYTCCHFWQTTAVWGARLPSWRAKRWQGNSLTNPSLQLFSS